jgi:hypothetical protein
VGVRAGYDDDIEELCTTPLFVPMMFRPASIVRPALPPSPTLYVKLTRFLFIYNLFFFFFFFFYFGGVADVCCLPNIK